MSLKIWQELSGMAGNGWKWLEMAGNGWQCLDMSGMIGNGSKLLGYFVKWMESVWECLVMSRTTTSPLTLPMANNTNTRLAKWNFLHDHFFLAIEFFLPKKCVFFYNTKFSTMRCIGQKYRNIKSKSLQYPYNTIIFQQKYLEYTIS